MRHEINYVDPEGLDLIEDTVQINRTAKVMKGGRRFGFSALVVVGDGRGVVGLGFGKAREVPPSIEKGITDAKKNLQKVNLKGTTVPHSVVARFRSSTVKIMPAAPGTGIIAGAAVRKVLEAAGVKDVLTKALGSKNPMNLAKATLVGLASMKTRREIATRRGVEL
ncbi:MAG: 30S ribosomal protein S5 [Planctomycetota bacterium]|nr:30S ribosomal protein S5 [Planctomycetota bacterium]